MTTEELIARYCMRRGISREQYDVEPVLLQETIEALGKLHDSKEKDPIIPPGLPGAGKRRSALTDMEKGLLAMLADLHNESTS